MPVPSLKEKESYPEKEERQRISETPGDSLLVEKDVWKEDKTRSERDQEKMAPKEDIVDPKDDVPQLLAADDLQRLAANQPKSLQPPVLIRRGTVLDETIEKLKKRVVSPDVSLLNLRDAPADKESGFGGMKSDDVGQEAKDPCTSDKKDDYYGDKHDDIERSESSSPSRNSSSLSQSTSSRSSSPAVELINRFKESKKKSEQGEKSFEKGEHIIQLNFCHGKNPAK